MRSGDKAGEEWAEEGNEADVAPVLAPEGEESDALPDNTTDGVTEWKGDLSCDANAYGKAASSMAIEVSGEVLYATSLSAGATAARDDEDVDEGPREEDANTPVMVVSTGRTVLQEEEEEEEGTFTLGR